MFVSIIIPTYNRAESIKYTLDSFLKQTYPQKNYEIIVCDNNSTDNVKEVISEYVRKYGEKKVRYIFEGRQGVHHARNSAAKIAKGDILYFTDDDMLADPDLLKRLIPIFTYNSKIGCASGRVLPKWEVEPPQWIKKYCNNFLLSLIDLGKMTKISRVDIGVYSCHEAIRREAFFMTGGFHPEYVKDTYFGDGESGLNQDIRKAGWLFAYVGQSKIYHMIPAKRMTQKHINKVLSNTGIAVSYSSYRENVFEKEDLPRIYKGYLTEYLKNCKKIIDKVLIGESSMRFIIAITYYYRSRILYDYRIIKDVKFREAVIANNWME